MSTPGCQHLWVSTPDTWVSTLTKSYSIPAAIGIDKRGSLKVFFIWNLIEQLPLFVEVMALPDFFDETKIKIT